MAAKLVAGFQAGRPGHARGGRGSTWRNFRSRQRRGAPPTLVLATALGGASESHDALEFIRHVMPTVRSQYPESAW